MQSRHRNPSRAHSARVTRFPATAVVAFERLEERCLLAAPVSDVIGAQNVPASKPFMVPVTANDADGDTLAYQVVSDNPNVTATLHEGNPWLQLEVEGHGTLVFQLFRDLAPQTVDIIGGLVQARFYDGLTFHRLIDNFMLQGGNAAASGRTTPPIQFDDEFHANAIFTSRGQLAMAKSDDDTNNTQFFITDGAPRHLDFQHTIFGQLVRGFDVFDSILATPVGVQGGGNNEVSRPLTPLIITSARLIENSSDAVVTIRTAGTASGNITVTVNDGNGGSFSRSFAVQGVTDPTNTPPFLGPVPDVVTPINTPVQITLSATDIDGGTLVFARSSPAGAVVDIAENIITVTPNAGFSGIIDLLVGVRDPNVPAGGSTSQMFDLQTVRIGVGDFAIHAQPATLSAFAALSSTFQVGTFVDTDPNGQPSDFTASIYWGDGTVSSGIISAGPGNTRLVRGQHAYAWQGSYPVLVTISGNAGARAKLTSTANVAFVNLPAQGFTISGTEEAPIVSATLASFADPAGGAIGSFSAGVNWGDGISTPGVIVANATGGFDVRGTHTYAEAGVYLVKVTISKLAGATTEVDSFAQIADIPPVVIAPSNATVDEGEIFSASGSFTATVGESWTATVNYGDGTGTQPLALNPDKTYTLSHIYADNGAYTVTIIVTDDGGAPGIGSLLVTVSNVAPSASIGGDANGVRYQPRAITLSANDPSAADTAFGFSYAIDWGDGTAPTNIPAGGTIAYRAFAAVGVYTVTVTAFDKNGAASEPQTRTITINGIQLQADPGDPTKKTLAVGGTAAADRIVVLPAAKGQVQVKLGSKSLGTFKPTGRISVFGGPGNDRIELSSLVNRTAHFDGGAGNDTLIGGPANDILLGGPGNDVITGNAGRDILIGGIGLDNLNGGDGDDILVAGQTIHDSSATALAALLKQWSRTTQAYTPRVANIKGPNPGLNGAFFLNVATIQSDAHADILTGGLGADLFYSNTNAGVRDKTDKIKSETLLDIN